VLTLLYWILQLYVLALIAYAVMSFIRPRYGSPLLSVQRFLGAIVEPVLRPVRRLLPTAQIGGMGIDFSVTIVVLVIEFVLLPLLVR
jgi:uncharacterized protein YggT (Ycf19 family)